jgi:hypothetical protein
MPCEQQDTTPPAVLPYAYEQQDTTLPTVMGQAREQQNTTLCMLMLNKNWGMEQTYCATQCTVFLIRNIHWHFKQEEYI